MDNLLTILPDSIAIYKDIQAFDVATAKQLSTINIAAVLVYNIDQVSADAIPVLADQFDVLGYKGMRLANTEIEQRQIIKRAIELHKYKGTKWAVQEAMKSVGFADAKINEHVNGHWANFSITLLNEGVGITNNTIADLRNMIEEYKPQRCNLVDIVMEFLITDEIIFGDDQEVSTEDVNVDDIMVFTNNLLYDGAGKYNGNYDHSGDSDQISITQI